MMLSDVCLSVCLTSVAYIGPKSRTDPRKTKIGIKVAHVTRDSDTTFKVRRSKVKVTGVGAYCGGLPPTAYLLRNGTRPILTKRNEPVAKGPYRLGAAQILPPAPRKLRPYRAIEI